MPGVFSLSDLRLSDSYLYRVLFLWGVTRKTCVSAEGIRRSYVDLEGVVARRRRNSEELRGLRRS